MSPGTDTSYSLIVVGTGFASTFFLWKYLQRAAPGARILVLERGPRTEHRQLIELQIQGLVAASSRSFVNRTPEKPWIFSLLFGGGSNCWTGNTPRQLPEDFELFSRYGVGRDWPLTYDELEEHYCDAEDLLGIAGPSTDSPCPRSRPYPQPAHRMSRADLLFKQAFPSEFFALPAARPSRPTARRPRCCANGVCFACPINSKFTVLNAAAGDVYRDPRVSLLVGARADTVDVVGSSATGVTYTRGGHQHSARGELVALGANGIFNPHLLLASGFEQPALGRGLCEQVSVVFDVHLDGVDNFQGSSLHTGHGYMSYRGKLRRERAAALIETWNAPPILRLERGKWRRRMLFKFIFEDLPRSESTVAPSVEDPSQPEVRHAGLSAIVCSWI